jgi:hypothetical protein
MNTEINSIITSVENQDIKDLKLCSYKSLYNLLGCCRVANTVTSLISEELNR